jgi:hypothetical protein
VPPAGLEFYLPDKCKVPSKWIKWTGGVFFDTTSYGIDPITAALDRIIEFLARNPNHKYAQGFDLWIENYRKLVMD